MSARKPRRKLLYPVGLLSLSFLPLLNCDYLLQDYLHRGSLRVLEITCLDPRDKTYLDPLKFAARKFKSITLTGETDDKIILDEAPFAIRDVIHQKDIPFGVEYTFAHGAKYESLIKLLNICTTENVRFYVYHKDKLWIFNTPPKRKQAFRRRW